MIIFWVIFLIIIQRKSSVKTFVRLLLTILVLYFVYIKAIVNNQNIIIFTVIITFLITTLNILIKEGIHRKSFFEIISVLITELICGVAILIININTEISIVDANKYADLNSTAIDKSIIFGILAIALLGIFIDNISRILSKLDDDKNKAQDITWKEQFKAGLDIGKDVINEKINMVFLIFAGITILPVCLYLKNGSNIFQVLEKDSIFLSIIMMFIGGIGILVSVPITSFVYAMFNRKKTIYKTVSDNKINGKRSLKL
jgi:uncharacterized membrane protein